MPDQRTPIQFPAAPQAFTFAGRSLMGFLTRFSDSTLRRYAIHHYPKRKLVPQRVEDMERDGKQLQVRLVFIGPNAARDARDFEQFVDQNPVGLLIHPRAGRWTAFCVGPSTAEDFSQAIDRVEVQVQFIETESNVQLPVDTPDVATASQNCQAQQTAYQQSTATFMGQVGKLQTQAVAALNSIDAQLALVQTLTAPVAAMQTVVNTALGAASKIVGILASVRIASDALNQDVTNFINAATAFFSGGSLNATASSDNVANTLAIVQADAATLENALLALSATPAGAANAVRDEQFMVDNCMTLSDAVQAALPPTTSYTVPATIGLIPLAQQIMLKFLIQRDPSVYAQAMLALNRIPNPQAIAAGTILTVPIA